MASVKNHAPFSTKVIPIPTMRFRIRHLFMLMALIAIGAYVYTQQGMEYLELQVMEIEDDGDSYSLMWAYQNCPVADSVQDFNTIELIQMEPYSRIAERNLDIGDVIKTRYRRKAVWPMNAEEPWQAVLRQLGFDPDKRVSHNGLVINR